MDSLLVGPFTTGTVKATRLAFVLAAAVAAFTLAPAAIGQSRRIRRRFSFHFTRLPDADARAILQPVGPIHRHLFSDLQTALDVGAGLVG